MSKNSRKRQVNVAEMSSEQADAVGVEIGRRIQQIGDAAAKEINEITKIYGIKAQIAVQLLDDKTGTILS